MVAMCQGQTAGRRMQALQRMGPMQPVHDGIMMDMMLWFKMFNDIQSEWWRKRMCSAFPKNDPKTDSLSTRGSPLCCGIGHPIWLVDVGGAITILKNVSSSMGRMKTHIWHGIKKCSKIPSSSLDFGKKKPPPIAMIWGSHSWLPFVPVRTIPGVRSLPWNPIGPTGHMARSMNLRWP